MDTAERMMIAGLSLQGLLANTRTNPEDVEANVDLAMAYANRLSGFEAEQQPAAVRVVTIARVAYATYMAMSPEDAGPKTLDEAAEEARDLWFTAAMATQNGNSVPADLTAYAWKVVQAVAAAFPQD